MLTWLDDHNGVSRGLLLPDGDCGPLDSVHRVLGYVPSWIETFSSRAMKISRCSLRTSRSASRGN